MDKSKLVCDACGAPINLSEERNIMRCPYCGAKYLIESTYLPAAEKPIDRVDEGIIQLLSEPSISRFKYLNRETQLKVIEELKDYVGPKCIYAIRIIRMQTNVGLNEGKEILERIKLLLNIV